MESGSNGEAFFPCFLLGPSSGRRSRRGGAVHTAAALRGSSRQKLQHQALSGLSRAVVTGSQLHFSSFGSFIHKSENGFLYLLISNFTFSFFKKIIYLFIFRERGREG